MRHIFTAAAAICVLAASAQTADSPQVIVTGQNSATVDSWQTIYFSYTPDADQLVTIEGIKSALTITSGDDNVPCAGNSTDGINVFAAKADTEYRFSYFSTSAGTLDFTVSTTPRPYTDATTCATAVEASATPFFVPFYKAGGFMAPAVIIYIHYTAPEDGRLDMTFTGSVSNMAIAEGCSGEFTTLDGGEYDGDGWKISADVDAGVEYIVRGSASTAMMATFKTVQPVLGATCADAWPAKRGENAIPAEAGTYWYSFTTPAAPARSFAVLKSAAGQPGGKVTVKSSCSSSYGDITLDGEMALRLPLTANSFKAICIEKAQATAAEESFTLSFQDYQTYDDFATAEPLENGVEMTTPDFGGTYYYQITAPAKGSYFLDLSTTATDLPAGTSVELYDSEKDFLSLASGTSSLHYEATPGVTYVIKWTCPNTLRSLPFTVAFNAVKPGETEGNPLQAVLGTNEIPQSAAVFFSYTAASDSWLAITPSAEALSPKVTYTGASGFKTDAALYAAGSGSWRFEATAGTDYLIEFRNTRDGDSFELAEQPYAPGESASNPIEVEGNTLTLGDAAGKTWMRYTATDGGILTVATTMQYAYGNSVYVYLNEVSDANRQSMSPESYSSSAYSPLELTVAAGDLVTVCATTATPQPGATFTFSLREPAEGETPSRPIAIDFATNPMDYDFEKAVSYGDKPVWYSISLSQEIFNLSSQSTFSMTMYSNGDTENAIAQSSGSMWGPNELKNVIVPSPGTYLLKLTSASAPFTATLSEREAEQGETPAKAIEIKPSSNPFNYVFSPVSYSDTPVWYSIKLTTGDFNLSQSETATAALYKEGDYSTPLAKLQYSFSSDLYEISNLAIAQVGTYYYKVESAYTECNATLSGTAIDTSFLGSISVETDHADAVYYDLQGVRVDEPSAGLYIRVTGNKVEKVLVK